MVSELKIQFIDTKTDKIIDGTGWLFVMDNTVYQDNFNTCESQSSVVGFDSFIKPRPDIQWEVV